MRLIALTLCVLFVQSNAFAAKNSHSFGSSCLPASSNYKFSRNTTHVWNMDSKNSQTWICPMLGNDNGKKKHDISIYVWERHPDKKTKCYHVVSSHDGSSYSVSSMSGWSAKNPRSLFVDYYGEITMFSASAIYCKLPPMYVDEIKKEYWATGIGFYKSWNYNWY